MVQTTARWATYRAPDALPDDTEESVVGTEWHQEAIGDLAQKLREAGRRHEAAWGVCEQIALVGLRHADGRPYDPRPDVMVLPRPLPSGRLSAIALGGTDGAPLFVAEVASRSTVDGDTGDKRHAYAAIGVAEYVVFDPDGALLPAGALQAWRLDGGAFVPWAAQADGWWYSSALGVSLQPAQPVLALRDREGQAIPPVGLLHSLLDGERRRRLELEDELRRLRDGREA